MGKSIMISNRRRRKVFRVLFQQTKKQTNEHTLKNTAFGVQRLYLSVWSLSLSISLFLFLGNSLAKLTNSMSKKIKFEPSSIGWWWRRKLTNSPTQLSEPLVQPVDE